MDFFCSFLLIVLLSFIFRPFLRSAPIVDLKLKNPLDVQINLKLQNILMLLKRCCNHPYLLEYPLDPASGEFKVRSTRNAAERFRVVL